MMNRRGRYRWTGIMQALFGVSMLLILGHAVKIDPNRVLAHEIVDYPLYLPVIYNNAGKLPAAENFQLVYADTTGAWLSSFDGHYRALLTTDVEFGAEDDIVVVRVAPTGQHVAIRQADGWAIYQRNTVLVASSLGPGSGLAWDVATNAADLTTVLLSKKDHGIDRWSITSRQATPLIATSDDTNDHSPLWNGDGSQLVFAHHEFGSFLYVTLIGSFDNALLPYQGENRAADKTNDALLVIEAVDSWHDQPLAMHWSNDERSLIFAAKQTIYVVDMATKDAVTITPLGFGERATGRAVDVVNDQILYFANDGIYVVGLDGQNPRRVVEGSDLHYPQWTPSGQQIVYRGTDDRLYIVNADRSNNAVIPHTEAVQQFALLP